MEEPDCRIWAKLDEIKMVKNCCKKKCNAEIGELGSVKNLFWANLETKKPKISPKRK